MNKMLSILSVYKNSSHNPDFIGFINDDIVKATFVLIKILNKKKNLLLVSLSSQSNWEFVCSQDTSKMSL